MTTPTHILTGTALGTVLVVVNESIVPFTVFQVILLCIIFSNILDINILWKRQLITHHKDITHYPIFSVIVSIITLGVNLVFFPESIILFQIVFLSLFIHLVQDTFGASIGIHWFWPYTDKEYSFIKLNRYDSKRPMREKIFLFKYHLLLELVQDIILVGVILYGVYILNIYQ